MTGPAGNSEFYFLSTSDCVALGFPKENTEGLSRRNNENVVSLVTSHLALTNFARA